MAWVCCKCNTPMEEVDDIKLNFNGTDLPEAEGLRCPMCKTQYLLSEYVVEALNPSEVMMAGK